MNNFNNGSFNTLSSNGESNYTSLDKKTDQLIIAEVVDIIDSSNHPDYTVNNDIGKIKFRLLTEIGKDNNNLNFALPANTNSGGIPLKGEIVLIIQVLDTYYYILTLNINNTLNSSDVSGVTSSKLTKQTKQQKSTISKNNLKQINPGASISQGRYGNFLILTDKDNKPVTILSNSENFEVNDLNNINGCVYISSNGIEYNSKSANNGFYNNTADINNGQFMLIKSDNLMMDSETNNVIATDSINLSSSKILMNCDDAEINTKNTKIKSKNVIIGNNGEFKAVLGEELTDILSSLLDALSQLTVKVTSAPGESLPPSNLATFLQLKNKLRKILSKNVKID